MRSIRVASGISAVQMLMTDVEILGTRGGAKSVFLSIAGLWITCTVVYINKLLSVSVNVKKIGKLLWVAVSDAVFRCNV